MELIDNPRISVTESVVPIVAPVTWDDIALIMRSQDGTGEDAARGDER
jgi:hypothetical protein